MCDTDTFFHNLLDNDPSWDNPLGSSQEDFLLQRQKNNSITRRTSDAPLFLPEDSSLTSLIWEEESTCHDWIFAANNRIKSQVCISSEPEEKCLGSDFLSTLSNDPCTSEAETVCQSETPRTSPSENPTWSAQPERKQSSHHRGVKPRVRKNKKPVFWTDEDHFKFLQGLERYGLSDSLGPGGAELISMWMGNRTPLQVRSHAQKHFSDLQAAQQPKL
mmetsp:Transcript_40523/g.82819  ORF Transcript_40523/g.82819 Transcript_40523/m.82819 type:complete len:218 (-) Transcript_40523:43-696(-)|eukprot:CAMPEP_0181318604 /NCGR_PEP_ID=MMETSP1101-20121128/17098_1 /TAXON_ID=46948 /ORGANISM="Rhodomonas abbreviata, Strain Caron Lab Isolate" /LENGTH=217 /DNA_ID=CAMNT_0023426091 /DNA_START=87 /DNA_END=740 /DNA_ORIENTATION=+